MNIKELISLRKKLVAISIATTMSFTMNGCNTSPKRYTENTENSNYNIELIELDNYIDEIIPKYKNESFYLTQMEVNKLIRKSKEIKKCDYIYNCELDSIVKNIKKVLIII